MEGSSFQVASSPLSPPPDSLPSTPVTKELAHVTVSSSQSKRAFTELGGNITPSPSEAKRCRLQSTTTNGPATRTRSKANAGGSSTANVGDRTSDITINDTDGASLNNIIASLISGAKPDPVEQPEIWAETRSALCHALRGWFNAHQSSQYTPKGTGKVTGMLMDGHPGLSDVLLDQVIITSIGGGRKQVNGSMIRNQSQDADSYQVRHMQKTMELREALGVILGSKNPLLRIEAPHEYNVAGSFIVTDMWCEAELNSSGDTIHHYKVRFEKEDLSKPSFYTLPQYKLYEQFEVGEYTCERQLCDTCHTESKKVYTLWVCLDPGCSKYFKAGSELLSDLTYNTNFLRERKDRAGYPTEFMQLKPELPQKATGADSEHGVESRFRMGIVCPQCCCCSRRVHWKGWSCENKKDGCDFAYDFPFDLYPIDTAVAESDGNPKLEAANFDKYLVKHHQIEIDGYKVDNYLLPNEDGCITGSVSVYKATREICSKPNGPDYLYEKFQTEDLNLRRNPAMGAGSRIEQLSAHFSRNYGAEYKFGVIVESDGFDKAPEIHMRGLAQLTYAQTKTLPKLAELLENEKVEYDHQSMTLESQDPNELLILGYFEDCHISYHDDGEKELGPTVATLSLGSPAIMRFRPKWKTSIGGKEKGNRRVGKSAVLTIPLEHGDIVLMHGIDLQKVYEHEVTPVGKLRFALTARFIRPEMILDPEARARAIKDGKVPEGNEKLAYGGLPTEEKKDAKMVNDSDD